ncbi:MAG TPA: WGR domain-containing protein [Ktedonobacterales bacterium]|nr:WGR domain-containing protein [Ktedonobacterales bacterium]
MPLAPSRHPALSALPAVVRFQQYARFERRDPTENVQRFYTLTWQPLLWSGGSLVRTWGRVGTHGLSTTADFPDRASAQPLVERLIRRRLTRRYALVDWA